MSDYMNYLEESTNTVKSQKKLSITILISTYLGVWAFALIVFWSFTSGSDALGYCLIFLWMILPVSTLVTSLLFGKNNYFGKQKWLLPVAFGVMHMLAEYATFSTKNMIAFHKINMPDFALILTGAIISFIGLGIGTLLNCRSQKRRTRKSKRSV